MAEGFRSALIGGVVGALATGATGLVIVSMTNIDNESRHPGVGWKVTASYDGYKARSAMRIPYRPN